MTSRAAGRYIGLVVLGTLTALAVLATAPLVAQERDDDGVDVGIPTNNVFVPQGAGPILGGQSEGITNNPVVGAINTLAPHPSDANILYAGSVNGGIWRTTNALTSPPTWTRLTTSQSSLSIGHIAFDPTVGTNQTLVAGIGRFSSYGGLGGTRSGLLRTTDGVNFTEIGGTMAGRNIVAVAPRGATMIAAVDVADTFACTEIGIWRSTNTGSTWTQILAGTADALASHPASTSTLYASIVDYNACGITSGIYKSTDTGANWNPVSSAAMNALLVDDSRTNVDIAVNPAGIVYVAIVPGNTGQLGDVFRSDDGGATWESIGVPLTFEDTVNIGIHPGTQGSIHLSLAADPTDEFFMYIGGDRQPRSFGDAGGFPNALGAMNFSGRLFRGDFIPDTPGWWPLTHSGTASGGGEGVGSSPHADSRVLVFDANNRLLEGDDGGIYLRTAHQSNLGDWFDMNGNIQVTEQHDTALDALNSIILSGNQDTGSGEQLTTGGIVWNQISQGDGGDVASGAAATAGQQERYSSFQNLGAFTRRTFNSSNGFVTQVYPARTVTSGDAFVPQFLTPVAVNTIDPARLVFGAGNGVYESSNRGDTLTQISTSIVTSGFLGGGGIAAGGLGNADLLFVAGCTGGCFGGSDDGLYRRTTSGGALSHVLSTSSPTTRNMVGVTIDPDDATQVFAVDNGGGVFRSTSTGASGTWSSVSGNLGALNPGALRSIEFVNSSEGDAIMVGADRGVFMALESSSFSTWVKFGVELPNTPVMELTYDQPNDALIVGTLGSGSYKVSALSTGAIFADGFESGTTSAWSSTVP